MTELGTKILKRFQLALENMADNGRLELARQGHKATGSLINSLEAKITSSDIDRLVGVIMSNDYGVIVDQGVPPNRVPFGGGSGNSSQYIQGLLNWVSIIRPGLSSQEAKSFVFAIANTHKKEGIPSRGSYAFTSNGRRKNWIKFGLESQADQLEKDLRLFAILSLSFEEAFKNAAS